MTRMQRVACVFVALGAACGRPPVDGTYIPQTESELAGRALSPAEAQLVARNGFAILSRGEVASFHVGYTALFHRHQPVYVTADALLYAWHSSYDVILMRLEQSHLMPAMHDLLVELRGGLADRTGDARARADVDEYLAIALSLADDKLAAPVAGGDPAVIAAAFAHAHAAEGDELVLGGVSRRFDFTMLKPRGHYTEAPFPPYFRAMSWLGRVELAIASRSGPRTPWVVDRRALRAAALLGGLVTGPARAHWDLLDRTLSAFVGPRDSMSAPELQAALATLHDLDAPDADVVAALRGPSAQRIRTQLVEAGAESLSFVTLGQRFVQDSQVLSDLVAGTLETKPLRLMPSPLDVAHAVFHNPAARPRLAGDLERFGAAYSAALDAEARLAPDAATAASLYHRWLSALRELSPDPVRDRALPAPLTSDAWARRMLDAQLASWAELRHDNLLYAKPSDSIMLTCAYPDGYVDPYPAFYTAMEALARRGRAILEQLAPRSPDDARLLAYFDGFGATMARLRQIAERERANQPMTDGDLDFLNHMVSLDGRHAGCTIEIEPQGWYADLYYSRDKILAHEPVIADVHTQPSDEAGNTVGRVLHVGTLPPRALVVRLDHDRGAHTQTYRGFVSSYAETITRDFQRYTDEEWREKLGTVDATPAWLRPLIAP